MANSFNFFSRYISVAVSAYGYSRSAATVKVRVKVGAADDLRGRGGSGMEESPT